MVVFALCAIKIIKKSSHTSEHLPSCPSAKWSDRRAYKSGSIAAGSAQSLLRSAHCISSTRNSQS